MISIWDYKDILWKLSQPEGWRKFYRVWSIKKKNGGRRWICAPQGRLKQCQTELVLWLNHLPIHPAAKAFLPGGPSNIEVVRQHALVVGEHGSLITADIEDFFGHVTAGLLQWMGLPADVIQLITVPHPHRGLVLPQGAPTSPPASNIAMREFDEVITTSLPPEACYTRWADDIGISAPYQLDPYEIKQLLRTALRQYGFRLAPHKFRYMTRDSGMSYLGISLYNGLRVPRRYLRKLRSKQHHFQMGDTTEASLRGMVDYVNRVPLL